MRSYPLILKYQLMTPFCLEITRITQGDIAASYFQKVTLEEVDKYHIKCVMIDMLTDIFDRHVN